ncbi:MAG: putative membrane protein YdjX (TVP38/TMEM64 family) [Flavobacteriales bacterium]|jgi:uncharacterized membrane protein YdjX (TVP38/TMEM64 family)
MKKNIFFLILIVLLMVAFYVSGINSWMSIESLSFLVEKNFIIAASVYCGIFTVLSALNLPGSGPFTIIAGAVFGFTWGLILALLALSLGAVASMFIARRLFREWAEKKFGKLLTKVNAGMDEDGELYLFSLRILPGVPYFLVNPVMGLTHLSYTRFFVVSVFGMLPVVAVTVNAGSELGSLSEFSLMAMMTPQLIISFALMAIFPFFLKRLVNTVRNNRNPKN